MFYFKKSYSFWFFCYIKGTQREISVVIHLFVLVDVLYRNPFCCVYGDNETSIAVDVLYSVTVLGY